MVRESTRYKKEEPVIIGKNDSGKIAPSVIELEESVIGALLLDREAYDIVNEILDAKQFYKEAHSIIYEAITNLYGRSEPTDLLTVAQELRRIGMLEKIGGAFALTKLTDRITSAANVEFHARLIQEKYIARGLIKIAGLAMRDAYEDGSDIYNLLDKVETEIMGLTSRLTTHKSIMIGELVRKIVRDIENFDPATMTIGTSTGFKHFDSVIHGLQAPNLIIIAARPAMGKTSFALNIIQNVAIKLAIPVAFYSYEMSSEELGKRFIATECEIPLEKIIMKDKSVLVPIVSTHNYGDIMNGQIHIEDVSTMTVMGIRSDVKKKQKKYGIQGIVVDYIQKVHVDKSIKSNQMREGDVSEITSVLKSIAKELGIWVIALSQLNRELEKRPSKRPILSDLRESGAIEQDADIVAFIHRPEYYDIMTDEDGESTVGMAEIIIAKNRNGSPQKVKQKFLGQYTKFIDVDYYKPVVYIEEKNDDNPF